MKSISRKILRRALALFLAALLCAAQLPVSVLAVPAGENEGATGSWSVAFAGAGYDKAGTSDTVTAGTDYNVSLKLADHYTALPGNITVTVGGVTITGYTYTVQDTTAMLQIPAASLTGAVVIKIDCVPDIFAVNTVLTNLTYDDQDSAPYGIDFTITLKPAVGYALPASVAVTYSGNDAAVAGCTYDAGTGRLTVPGSAITGALTITAATTTKADYAVTQALSHLRNSNTAATVRYDETDYTAALTADAGYRLPESVAVTYTGSGASVAHTFSGGQLRIDKTLLTAPLTLTAVGTELYDVKAAVSDAAAGTLAVTVNGSAVSGTLADAAAAGDPVSVRAELSGTAGVYELTGVSYAANGQTVQVALDANGAGSFLMPAGDVTVTAQFRQVKFILTYAASLTSGQTQLGSVSVTDADSAAVASGDYVRAGETLTVAVSGLTGHYKTTGVKYTVGGAATDLAVSDAGPYSFAMPEGDTTLAVEAGERVYAAVSGANLSLSPAAAVPGTDYTGTLAAARGYKVPAAVTVQVGGQALASTLYSYSAGTLTVQGSAVTDDITVVAEADVNVYTGGFIAAPLTSDTLYTSYGISGTALTAAALQRHANANGIMGYWVGIGIAVPAGTDYGKVQMSLDGGSTWYSRTAADYSANGTDYLCVYWDAAKKSGVSLLYTFDGTEYFLTGATSSVTLAYGYALSLTGLTTASALTGSAVTGSDFTATFTALTGYTLPTSVQVSMGGGTAAAWALTDTTAGGKAAKLLAIPSGSITGDIAVTAAGAPISYTVRFNGNGGVSGTASTYDQTFAYDAAQALTANAFVRTGYVFTGWAKTSGGAKAYGDGESVSNLASAEGATVNLYAQWRAITYTVAYDANGGTGTTASQTDRTYDVSFSLRSSGFSRTGYTFAGWMTSAAGTESAYSGGEYVSNLTAADGDTVTLYALWSPHSYTVRFYPNYNYGTGSYTSVTRTYDDGAALGTQDFARTGYTLAGWAKSSTGSAAYTVDTTENLTASASYVNLWAVWTANAYTVTFNPGVSDNSAAGTMDTQSRSYDDGSALSACGYTRTGYSFAGWALSEGGAAVYADGTQENLTETAGGAVTLYAVWTPVSYTITFHKNDGTGETDTQNRTYNTPQALGDRGFAREGYTFAGWAETAGGAKVYDAALTADLANTEGAGVALYALWTANTYTVQYESGVTDGSVIGAMAAVTRTYGDGGSLAANAFSRIGYDFAGWTTASADASAAEYADGYTGDLTTANGVTITLTARWTAHGYSVIFHAGRDGASVSVTQSRIYDDGDTLRANTFTRTGYDFVRWETEDGQTAYADGAAGNLTAENGVAVNLYAVWEARSYTVAFAANGGTGAMDDQKRVYDDGLTLTACGFVRAGYDFVGWAEDSAAPWDGFSAAAAGCFAPASAENITGDKNATVTLYAVWEPHAYTVAFDGNAPTATGTMAAQTRRFADGVALTACGFVRTGYTFLGWSADKNATAATWTEGSTASLTDIKGETVTLYAVWAPKTYTVIFQGAGGTAADGQSTVTAYSQTFTYNDAENAAKTALTANRFTRPGFSFQGWTCADNNTTYADQQQVLNLTDREENLTFTARWKILFAAGNAAAVTADTWNGGWATGTATLTVTLNSAMPLSENLLFQVYADSSCTGAALYTMTRVNATTATLQFTSDINADLYVRVTDGVSYSDALAFSVRVDRTAPTDVSLEYAELPAGNVFQTLTFGLFKTSVRVRVTAKDSMSGIASFRLTAAGERTDGSLRNGLLLQGSELTEDPAGCWSATFDVSPQYYGELSVTAADKAGHTTVWPQTGSSVLALDTLYPTVSVGLTGGTGASAGLAPSYAHTGTETAPAADWSGEAYYTNTRAAARIAFTDDNLDLRGDGVANQFSVTVYQYDASTGALADTYTPALTDSSFAAGGTAWSASLTFGAGGDYTAEAVYVIAVTARDEAGNETSVTSARIVYDATAPAAAAGYTYFNSLEGGTVTPAGDTAGGADAAANTPTAVYYSGGDMTVRFTVSDPNLEKQTGGYAPVVTASGAYAGAVTAADTGSDASAWAAETHIGAAYAPLAAEGSYTLVLTARDRAGNAVTLTTAALWYDVTAPVIEGVTAPAADGEWYSASSLEVSGRASEGNSGLSSVTYAGAGTNPSQGTLPVTGTWSFTASGDQDVVYTITATDRAGNAGTGTYTVRLDTGAPTARLAVGTLGAWERLLSVITFGLWTPDEQTITLTGADPEQNGIASGVGETVWWLYEGDTPYTDAAALESAAVWTAAPSQTLCTLDRDAQFVAYARVKDRAGNVCYVSSDGVILDMTDSIVGDDTTPIVTITTPATASGIYNDDVQVGFDVVDPLVNGATSGIASVTYTVYKGKTAYSAGTLFTFVVPPVVHKSDLVQSLGAAALHITIPKEIDSNLVYVEVTATDNAGNSRTVRSAALIIDNSPPQVSVSFTGTPVNGQYFSEPRTATVTVTDRNFTAAGVKFGGTGYAFSGWSAGTDTDGDGLPDRYAATLTYSADGRYTFDISATDGAGHTTQGSAVSYAGQAIDSFVVDTTNPVVALAAGGVAQGGYSRSAVTVTITVTEANFDAASADNGLAVTQDGVRWMPAVSWYSAGDSHTATFVLSEDAQYTVDYSCTDLAGRSGRAGGELSFFVDTTAPVITVSGVADGSANNGETVAPVIQVSDKYYDAAGVRITVQGSHGEKTDYTTESLTDGQIFRLGNIADDGYYTITVQAADLAGNASAKLLLEPSGAETEKLSFSVNRHGSAFWLDDDTLMLVDKFFSNIYLSKPQGVVIYESNVNRILERTVTVTSDTGELLTLQEGTDYAVTETKNEAGWYQYTYVIKASAFAGDGTFSVQVMTVDEAGNRNENDQRRDDAADKNSTVLFCVDTTLPYVQIYGFENGRSFNALEITVSFLVQDTNLNGVTIYINNMPYQTLSGADLAGMTQYAGQFTLPESGERQSVAVVATDAAGNENEDENGTTGATGANMRSVEDITVSTNPLVRWFNNTALYYSTVGGFILLVAFITVLFVFNKRRDGEDDK